MRPFERLVRLASACSLLVVSACATESAPGLAPAEKIDPPLQEAITAGAPARAIVLGRTQLVAPMGGLESFAKEHTSDDRHSLRTEVIATLNANATWAESSTPILLQPDVTPPFVAEGKQIAWNVAHVNAPRVWSEFNNTGAGAVIAVLDNGANYAHQDLRANLWRNAGETPNNNVDDDGNGLVDDVYGYDFGAMSANLRDTSSDRQHGTMTSGIAVGDGTGGMITGVAPRARLMLLKMTSDNVDGAGGRPIAAALAYQYALENGADILSMSFSLPNLGNLRGYWRIMSDHAVAAGLVLVGGSGNFRQTDSIPVQIQSPKDVPSVISVGGVDTLLELTTFSSMGPAEWSTVALFGDYPLPAGIIKPELVAFPGEGFPVLSVTDSGYIDTNVVRRRGNSFSGPQVAGVAALMFTERPGMSVWRLREILEATARDLGAPGPDNMFGYGLVDAFAAVEMTRKGASASR